MADPVPPPPWRRRATRWRGYFEPPTAVVGRRNDPSIAALPRGAYATMLIKRLFAPSWYSRPTDRMEPPDPRGRGRRERDLRSRSVLRYKDDQDGL